MDALPTFVAASVLTSVQLVPSALVRHLSEERRRRVHSAAGGVAVAFIFLHLLPEIDGLRDAVQDKIGGAGPLEEQVVFALAMAGLIGFYGIEIVARRSHALDRGDRDEATWPDHVGIGVFAGYYAAIGYLLWDAGAHGVDDLAVYTVAMALHFLVVDYGLQETHRLAYARTGRWLLAVSVLVGWAVGWAGQVPDWGLGILLSTFAGALVLVALKEELPPERAGSFPAFLAGAAGYTLLLATVSPSFVS